MFRKITIREEFACMICKLQKTTHGLIYWLIKERSDLRPDRNPRLLILVVAGGLTFPLKAAKHVSESTWVVR